MAALLSAMPESVDLTPATPEDGALALASGLSSGGRTRMRDPPS